MSMVNPAFLMPHMLISSMIPDVKAVTIPAPDISVGVLLLLSSRMQLADRAARVQAIRAEKAKGDPVLLPESAGMNGR